METWDCSGFFDVCHNDMSRKASALETVGRQGSKRTLASPLRLNWCDSIWHRGLAWILRMAESFSLLYCQNGRVDDLITMVGTERWDRTLHPRKSYICCYQMGNGLARVEYPQIRASGANMSIWQSVPDGRLLGNIQIDPRKSIRPAPNLHDDLRGSTFTPLLP